MRCAAGRSQPQPATCNNILKPQGLVRLALALLGETVGRTPAPSALPSSNGLSSSAATTPPRFTMRSPMAFHRASSSPSLGSGPPKTTRKASSRNTSTPFSSRPFCSLSRGRRRRADASVRYHTSKGSTQKEKPGPLLRRLSLLELLEAIAVMATAAKTIDPIRATPKATLAARMSAVDAARAASSERRATLR